MSDSDSEVEIIKPVIIGQKKTRNGRFVKEKDNVNSAKKTPLIEDKIKEEPPSNEVIDVDDIESEDTNRNKSKKKSLKNIILD